MTTDVPPAGAASMLMVPWCASTMRLAVGSPRPEPRALVVKNGVKILSRISAEMPGPRSRNAMRHVAIAAFDGDLDRAASVHRLRAIHQQVQEDDLEELGIRRRPACAAGDLDTDVPECRILAQQIHGERDQPTHVHGVEPWDSAGARTAADPSSDR